MTLVPMAEILREAKKGRYAVGGFDTWNLESVQSVIDAAEEERSPAIILTGPYGLGTDYTGLKYFAAIGKVAAEEATVPVALLLNEAPSFQLVVQGIRCGFTSVMIDGSLLPIEKNIDLTKRVVEAAHSVGVSVEAQLGVIPLVRESGEAFLTDPEAAAHFINETGVDALSVIIGNVHALYKGKAEIDLDRLKKIRGLIDTPLVLHGGTGLSNYSVRKAIRLGVCKFNVGTALRWAFIRGMKEAHLAPKPTSIDRYRYVEEILRSARSVMKNVVKNKMKLYGGSGQA